MLPATKLTTGEGIKYFLYVSEMFVFFLPLLAPKVDRVIHLITVC